MANMELFHGYNVPSFSYTSLPSPIWVNTDLWTLKHVTKLKSKCLLSGCSGYLLWFAVAWELHCDSSQVGGVGKGQESRAGFPSKHILLILRSLVAPHLKTQEEEEQEEDGRGGCRRHYRLHWGRTEKGLRKHRKTSSLMVLIDFISEK